MLPYHLACTKIGSLLYELSDGRFLFVSGSAMAPLMVGHQYVLVSNELAGFLESLDLDRVQFAPAVVWNRQQNQEIRTHKRLKIGQYFVPEQINDLNLDGMRLILMNDEYLFVSPELRDALESENYEYLRFTKGLSEFVAGAT